MFSRIRGLISCQSNTQTIAPTLSPSSSGHVSFAGVDYPLLPPDPPLPTVTYNRYPDLFLYPVYRFSIDLITTSISHSSFSTELSLSEKLRASNNDCELLS